MSNDGFYLYLYNNGWRARLDAKKVPRRWMTQPDSPRSQPAFPSSCPPSVRPAGLPSLTPPIYSSLPPLFHTYSFHTTRLNDAATPPTPQTRVRCIRVYRWRLAAWLLTDGTYHKLRPSERGWQDLWLHRVAKQPTTNQQFNQQFNQPTTIQPTNKKTKKNSTK